MINEHNIITYLKTQFPQQIGDDAAVLPISDEQSWVITQDLLIEDVHFRKNYQSPQSLAHKALHVNLSDIAAMGATPHTVLLGLSIPPTDEAYIQSFLEYFSKACHKANVILIGGDTTRAPQHQLFISVTLIGSGNPTHLKYRHTAQVNDIIGIAGELGEAHLGFLTLEQAYSKDNTSSSALGAQQAPMYQQKFLNPVAKTQEGLWLSRQTAVHAMMDISDGLYTDLEKLTRASHCGANIQLEYLTTDELFIHTCKSFELDPLETQLTGGEDYGLLFTVEQHAWEAIAQQFFNQFNYCLKKVGYITKNSNIILTEREKIMPLQIVPFSHF